MLTQEQITKAVATSRAYVRGFNSREQRTTQKILAVSFKDANNVLVFTRTSCYLVKLDNIIIK